MEGPNASSNRAAAVYSLFLIATTLILCARWMLGTRSRHLPSTSEHFLPPKGLAGRPKPANPAFSGLQGCLSCKDLNATLVALEQQPDSESREQIFQGVIDSLQWNEIDELCDFLLSRHTPAVAELLHRLVRLRAESDPPSTAAWAAGLPETRDQLEILKQVATVWAASDPRSAAAWVQSLSVSAGTLATVSIDVSYEAARSDPLLALETLGGLAPSPERDQALAYAISQWADVDPKAALDWASAIPSPELKQQLIATMAIAIAPQNAAFAADLAASRLEQGPQQERTAVSIVQVWAQTSPESAAAWVLRFPPGQLRATAAENLAAIWALHDPVAASQWSRTLEAGSADSSVMIGAPHSSTLP